MRKNFQTGYTLIEIMIVVVIIAILAAIAMPIYSSYAERSRRVDGMSLLMDCQQKMERYYSVNNTYVGATIGAAAADTCVPSSAQGFYVVSFSANPNADSYVLQATPQGIQANDSKCGSYSLSAAGVKGVVNASQTAAQCWR